MNRVRLILVGGLIGALVAAAAYATIAHRDTDIALLEPCLPERSGSPFAEWTSCVRDGIRTLLDAYAPRDIIDYYAANQRSYCHYIGHETGAETFRRSSSVEGSLAKCTGGCKNACLHGVIATALLEEAGGEIPEDLAHAPVEQLVSLGKRYCSQPDLCHGVGHIFFAATGAYAESLSMCAQMGTFNDQSCYEGVFMESLGGFEAFAQSVAAPAGIESYAYPCDAVAGPYRRACFRYLQQFQRIAFSEAGVTSNEDRISIAESTCASFAPADAEDCFEGLGNFAVQSPAFDDLATYCADLQGERESNSCMLGAVRGYTDLGRYADALGMCSRVPSTMTDLCYLAAFQKIEQTTHGVAALHCPADAWTDRCAEMLAKYRAERTALPDYRLGLPGE